VVSKPETWHSDAKLRAMGQWTVLETIAPYPMDREAFDLGYRLTREAFEATRQQSAAAVLDVEYEKARRRAWQQMAAVDWPPGSGD